MEVCHNFRDTVREGVMLRGSDGQAAGVRGEVKRGRQGKWADFCD